MGGLFLLNQALSEQNIHNYIEKRLSFIFDEPNLHLFYKEKPRGFGQLRLKDLKLFIDSEPKPILELESAQLNIKITYSFRLHFEAKARFASGGLAVVSFESNIFSLAWERFRYFGPARFSGKWLFHLDGFPLLSLVSLSPHSRALASNIKQGLVSGTIAYMETFPFADKNIRLKSSLQFKDLRLVGSEGIVLDEFASKLTLGGGKFKGKIGEQEGAFFTGRLAENGLQALIELSGNSNAMYLILVKKIGCPQNARALQLEYRRGKLKCYV